MAADPYAVMRDHPTMRAIHRGDPPNHIGQLVCPGCGAAFLLRSTLQRHRAVEIPAARAAA